MLSRKGLIRWVGQFRNAFSVLVLSCTLKTRDGLADKDRGQMDEGR